MVNKNCGGLVAFLGQLAGVLGDKSGDRGDKLIDRDEVAGSTGTSCDFLGAPSCPPTASVGATVKTTWALGMIVGDDRFR